MRMTFTHSVGLLLSYCFHRAMFGKMCDSSGEKKIQTVFCHLLFLGFMGMAVC